MEATKPDKKFGIRDEMTVIANKFVMARVPCVFAKSFHIDVVLDQSVSEFVEYARSKNANAFIAEDGMYIKIAFIFNGKIVGIVKTSCAAPNGIIDL